VDNHIKLLTEDAVEYISWQLHKLYTHDTQQNVQHYYDTIIVQNNRTTLQRSNMK